MQNAKAGNNTIVALNPAIGQPGTGFKSPAGLYGPQTLTSLGTTLFVSNLGNNTVSADTMATGAAVSGFNLHHRVERAQGLAVYGNDRFVADYDGNTVGEYNARTGAVINPSFITGLVYPDYIAAAPEPSTWALLGIGAAGAGVATSRRRHPYSPCSTTQVHDALRARN